MSSTELLQAIVARIKKFKLVVIGAGVVFAAGGLLYSIERPTTYTSKATLFPLLSPSDNTISNSMLQGILGSNDAPKSFSTEATINIIELAQSRRIRESVALTRLPQYGNKSIAELLIEETNNRIPFYGKKIELPKDSTRLAVVASEILKPNIIAKMNKNGVLELYYTGTREELITAFSNVIVDKLSKFYVDLKRQKALDDYNFTLDKIDSLQRMINAVDKDAIGMQQRTMFTPAELLEYAIPKENITSEKSRILRQRDMYINNRDEAVWRLQEVTPIIAVLDKPDAPFDEKSQPTVLLMIIGFLGAILGTIALISGLIYRYGKDEIYKSIYK